MKNIKIELEKERLFKLYVEENLSQQECAEVLGVSSNIIKKRLREFEIKKPKSKFKEIHKRSSNQTAQSVLKRKQTVTERYGVDNVSQLQEIKNKKEQTALKHFGTDNGSKKNYDKLFVLMQNDKDKSVKFMKEHINEYTIEDLCKELNVSYVPMREWLEKYDLRKYLKYIPTKTEDEIYDFIKDELKVDNIIRRTREVLDDKKELDIYIPKKNIAIEINGTYWHSEKEKGKKYHFNKSIECEKKGIRLIHIWQYEWEDSVQREKIKMMLRIALNKVENKIYARECEFKEITNAEAKLLNEKVHLQGHRNAQITYGLFYKDELVQLMSFSKTKYNRNLNSDNSWEIIRGCPGSNNIVVGGVSRLFKHFIKENNPELIFSYCDFNKFNGRSYEEIGMKFSGYTGPDMKYVLKDGKVVNRNPLMYQYNKEHMKWRLFGCGSKKYIWKR